MLIPRRVPTPLGIKSFSDYWCSILTNWVSQTTPDNVYITLQPLVIHYLHANKFAKRQWKHHWYLQNPQFAVIHIFLGARICCNKKAIEKIAGEKLWWKLFAVLGKRNLQFGAATAFANQNRRENVFAFSIGKFGIVRAGGDVSMLVRRVRTSLVSLSCPNPMMVTADNRSFFGGSDGITDLVAVDDCAVERRLLFFDFNMAMIALVLSKLAVAKQTPACTLHAALIKKRKQKNLNISLFPFANRVEWAHNGECEIFIVLKFFWITFKSIFLLHLRLSAFLSELCSDVCIRYNRIRQLKSIH